MTRTIIVSGTLKSLSIDDVTTSSQSYELQLARAFSEVQATTIISLVAMSDARREGLNLVGLRSKPRGLRAAWNLTYELLREKPRGVQVIAFGYDPLTVLPLIFSRALGALAYTVVFDTHLGASERLAPTKRALVNAYFSLGSHLLRALSGLFVVTRDAEDIFARVNRNVFRTRIGFDAEFAEPWARPVSEEFGVIYAGALEVYNGLQQMMDGVLLRNNQNESVRRVVLHLYGAGSLRPTVELYAKRYEAIRYHGVASKANVNAAVLRSSLAFNLRDLEHPVAVNAFPSKLIELLGSGVPVATTAVLPSAVLSRFALIVADVSAESVMEVLLRAEKSYETLVEQASLARSFVAGEYDWHVIVSDMSGFMGGVSATAV
jgi:glycosyltransferase involved in cell wall biosynthesis